MAKIQLQQAIYCREFVHLTERNRFSQAFVHHIDFDLYVLKRKKVVHIDYTSAKNMTATTKSEFNDQTEALDVAKAFPESIRGKTILVTGVNREGIGFTTAQAFVSSNTYLMLTQS